MEALEDFKAVIKLCGDTATGHIIDRTPPSPH